MTVALAPWLRKRLMRGVWRAEERFGEADDIEDGGAFHGQPGKSTVGAVNFGAPGVALFQFVNGLDDFGQVHFVDFEALADCLEQGDGQSPPRCSRNSSRPLRTTRDWAESAWSSSLAKRSKPSSSSKSQHAFGGGGVEKTHVARVNHVQRDADGDGFAVADSVFGKLFELVRGPMAEIERAGGAEFKGVAGAGDVVEVQFGAAMDEAAAWCAGSKSRSARGIALRWFQRNRGRG